MIDAFLWGNGIEINSHMNIEAIFMEYSHCEKNREIKNVILSFIISHSNVLRCVN